MLNQVLTENNSNYLKLSQFNTLQEFEEHYLDEWKRNHQLILWDILDVDGVPTNPFIEVDGVEIDLRVPKHRSEIVSGKHTNKNDEEDRLNWLKDCFKIHLLADSIVSPILAKDNLDIQKAMFKRYVFEFNELYKQVKERQFLVQKYSFILEELIKLKESVINKCGYLDDKTDTHSSSEIQSSKYMVSNTQQKIKWNADAASLGTLFYDLMYECQLANGKPYMSTDAEVVIQVLLNSFCKPDGDDFEPKAFDKYVIKNSNGKRNRDASRYKLLVKPKMTD